MSEATLILQNMRGGCATVGATVHTLFRVNGRRPLRIARPEDKSSDSEVKRIPCPVDRQD